MQRTIKEGPREGVLSLPPSKSIAHRKILLAALTPGGGEVHLREIAKDIASTLELVQALGGTITDAEKNGLHHIKIGPIPKKIDRPVHIHVEESATTLRIALVLAPCLAKTVTFTAGPQLKTRPVEEGIRFLREKGVKTTDPWPIKTEGRLTFAEAVIDASRTGQFISGALLAALTQERPVIVTAKNPVSRPYIHLTAEMIRQAGAFVAEQGDTTILRQGSLHALRPEVEGDYSHAAALIVANEMGSAVRLQGLHPHSLQGDRKIYDHIARLKKKRPVDLADTPDLLMPLAVFATKTGGVFTGTGRLRVKESDRVAATAAMLKNLGIETQVGEDTFSVAPGCMKGAEVHTFGDHRIAFAAFAAATAATGPVTVQGAEAVDKSWPGFFREINALQRKKDR
ncbi:MAG: hypothetical protein SOW18_02265 [Peptoniphilus sp.]|nr:hypothetical protein [Peptoniphilus sp.]MDY3118344.1 hypothetical protein [Peptoniphilus sp.]